jgi:hypothetical protein
MDERWRLMDRSVTLCAMNGAFGSLPGKVGSRLLDGRARVFELSGVDMRPFQAWGMELADGNSA